MINPLRRSKTLRDGRHALLASLAMAGALSLLPADPAVAEPKMTFATPGPGTTIGYFPGNFMLSFSEPVDLAQTRITIMGPDNTPVGLEKLGAYQNDVVTRLTGTMGDGVLTFGAYTVAWRTVSKTGEAASGGYHFTVKDCGEVTCP
jgi:methionine-rich copper-binding protein CopC